MAKSKKSKRSTLQSLNLELRDFSMLTDNQAFVEMNWKTGISQLMLGYPGTGKTFLAMYLAFKEIANPLSDIRKLVIFRSAVSSRDEGFLPGTEEEKAAPYEAPYEEMCSDLFGRDDAYSILKSHGVVEFRTTGKTRGINIDNAVIFVDEIQNLTSHEADTLVTRGKENTRVVVCGDILQRDLTKHAEKDIEKFLSVIKALPEDYRFTYFTKEDIVRSEAVKRYIIKKMELFPDGF